MNTDSEPKQSIREKILSHYSWNHTYAIIGFIVTFALYRLDHKPETENHPVEKPSQNIKQSPINQSLQKIHNKRGKTSIANRGKDKNGSSKIDKTAGRFPNQVVTTDSPSKGYYPQKNIDIGHKESKTINNNANNNGFTDYGITAGRTVYSQQPIDRDQEQTEEINPNNPIAPNPASRF